MDIKEVLDKLESSGNAGYQLSKRNGVLSSTWLIYKKIRGSFISILAKKSNSARKTGMLAVNLKIDLRGVFLKLKKL